MLNEDTGTNDIHLGDRIGRNIRAVHDHNRVGNPSIGFVVEDDRGIFAITHRDEITKLDNVDAAVAFIAKKWRYKR